MDGKITDWNAFNGRGEVSGTDGAHMVSAGDCSPGLRAILRNTAIPPDDPVEVTYDVAGTGEAINVDRAEALTLAASAEPMAAMNIAALKTAQQESLQPPPARKASGKEVTGKKAIKNKPRGKQVGKKPAAKKKTPMAARAKRRP